MSKKDVDKYYQTISNQYNEMVDNLKELESNAENTMISSDVLDNMKKMIIPLKQNYERISYLMFLLNQPSRKKKISKYINQNQKKIKSLDKSNDLQSVIKENQIVLDEIKNEKNSL